MAVSCLLMMLRIALLILFCLDTLVSGLIHSYSNTGCTTIHCSSSITALRTPSLLFSATAAAVDDDMYTNAAERETEANKFWQDLDDAGLSNCHGILHASGCRRISDMSLLSPEQTTSMGVDTETAVVIQNAVQYDKMITGYQKDPKISEISTTVGSVPYVSDGMFNFEVICPENEIYKGRLFTIEQCNELKRMGENHAYNTNPTWMGMPCKSISNFIPQTNQIFNTLFLEMYNLFPSTTMISNSLRFESDNEPHLVRYTGKAKGAPLHVDTDYKSITLNVLLSDPSDFGGGGTYIKAIDKVIKLKQGEMLIHPGNLDHAGIDITYGVRGLLVAFLECDWEEEDTATGPLL